MHGTAVRLALVFRLLAGVLGSVSAGSAVSRSQSDTARRLLQDNKAKCENEFNRTTIDGRNCCFPMMYAGKLYSDCVSIADKLYCPTGSNDSLLECVPQAALKLDDFFAPAPAPECFRGSSVKTVGGKTCSFPQQNTREELTCECFTLNNDSEETSYFDDIKYYCQPDGELDIVEECVAVNGTMPEEEDELSEEMLDGFFYAPVPAPMAADDEAVCENEFNRTTTSGEDCCFPVTFDGEQYYDCVSDSDRLWCATRLSKLLIECVPDTIGVSGVEFNG